MELRELELAYLEETKILDDANKVVEERRQQIKDKMIELEMTTYKSNDTQITCTLAREETTNKMVDVVEENEITIEINGSIQNHEYQIKNNKEAIKELQERLKPHTKKEKQAITKQVKAKFAIKLLGGKK